MRKGKVLDNEMMETRTAQIELDKTAQDFRTAHHEREMLIHQWEKTILQMKKRDQDIATCADVRPSDTVAGGRHAATPVLHCVVCVLCCPHVADMQQLQCCTVWCVYCVVPMWQTCSNSSAALCGVCIVLSPCGRHAATPVLHCVVCVLCCPHVADMQQLQCCTVWCVYCVVPMWQTCSNSSAALCGVCIVLSPCGRHAATPVLHCVVCVLCCPHVADMQQLQCCTVWCVYCVVPMWQTCSNSSAALCGVCIVLSPCGRHAATPVLHCVVCVLCCPHVADMQQLQCCTVWCVYCVVPMWQTCSNSSAALCGVYICGPHVTIMHHPGHAICPHREILAMCIQLQPGYPMSIWDIDFTI